MTPNCHRPPPAGAAVHRGWSPLDLCYVGELRPFCKLCHWSALAGRSYQVEPAIASHAAGVQ